MLPRSRAVFVLPLVLLFATPIHARDAARDLRRMIGYTIIDAASVDSVRQASFSEKHVRLDNGTVFRVEGMLLDPLPLTDVIVFAKPLPANLKQQYQGKVPDSMLYSYRLLIDNEAHDAVPVQR